MAPTRSRGSQPTRRADFSLDVDYALAEIARLAPDVVFLTSPNNPTGASIPAAEIAAIVDAAPGIVIVDEAYGEFSDQPSAVGIDRPVPGEGRRVADDEQGVRVRRRAVGVPGGVTGDHRRTAARAACPTTCRCRPRLPRVPRYATPTTLAGVACIVAERDPRGGRAELRRDGG